MGQEYGPSIEYQRIKHHVLTVYLSAILGEQAT